MSNEEEFLEESGDDEMAHGLVALFYAPDRCDCGAEDCYGECRKEWFK